MNDVSDHEATMWLLYGYAVRKNVSPPGRDIFSVPLFGLFFLLIFIFHFENLSKFIVFSNEDVRRIEPQTNNHKSNYRTTRPAKDELPDLRF